MTISLSNNAARVSYSVSQGATQSSFTVSFEFFDDDDLSLYVDGTLKTLTTHYTVSGGDGSTGTITMTSGNNVTGISGGSTVVITRDIDLDRVTDFPSSGPFAVATLNTELDRFTAIAADQKDEVDRALRLQDFDSAVSMELPLKAARLGTVLGFNASTGAPEAGPTIANVNSLSAITTNINTVAGIQSNVTTVAGISSNVQTVAGISGNVTTVAGITSNISSVVSNASNINTVAGAITNVNNVGGSISNVNTVAGAISNVNALAASAVIADMALLGNADVIADMALLATTDVIADMNTLATSDIVSDLNTLATSDIVSDINTLATSDIVSDLNTLATSDIVSDINTLATSDIVTDLNLLATSDFVSDLNTLATSANVTAVNNVSGSIANVNTVASNLSGVNSFAERYRVLSSDPGSDNDEGDLVYNTTDNNLKFFNGSSFVAVGGAISNIVEDTTPQLGADLDLNSNNITGTGNISTTGTATITTSGNTAQLTLTSTDADATGGPGFDLLRNSSSPANSDNIGFIRFRGKNSNGDEHTYGFIQSKALTVTDGSEDGGFELLMNKGGSNRSRMEVLAGETVFNEDSVDVDFRVESNGNTHAIFVDAGNDVVGIGTSTPNSFNANAKNLVVGTGSGSNGITIFAGNSSDSAIFFADNGSTATGQINYKHSDNAFTFHISGGSEGMRLDSSGNFLVGKTASGSFTESSVELNNTGYVMSARNDGANIFLSRQGSSAPEGAMISLSKVNTEIGRIGVKSSRMYMGSSSTGLAFEGSQADSIYPVSASGDGSLRDNAIDLGFASSRFDDIFATNSTINTSDENEKQNITSLTSAEITAAKAISKLFKTYKWKDKVTAKGDAARTHTGVVAQEVQKAMTDAGLDATKYAFWCSNTWWEVEETITDDDGKKHTGMMSYQTEEEAPEDATKRTRLGVRYPELLAFIGAATEQRLADIESRLAALEE